jgi:hypothetical protein
MHSSCTLLYTVCTHVCIGWRVQVDSCTRATRSHVESAFVKRCNTIARVYGNVVGAVVQPLHTVAVHSAHMHVARDSGSSGCSSSNSSSSRSSALPQRSSVHFSYLSLQQQHNTEYKQKEQRLHV